MDSKDPLTRALIRLLQAGTLEKIVGCEEGQQARVEWTVTRTYRVHFTRRLAGLHERVVEGIRYRLRGRWRYMSPATINRGRIILDRMTGKILRHRSHAHEHTRTTRNDFATR